MGITRRALFVNGLRLAGGLALASCAPTGPAASSTAPTAAASAGDGIKRGGTLVYADWADATTLDPAFMRNQSGRRPGKAIFDSLVEIDAKGTIIPKLAESWDVPDPKTYVLHLRKGVKFHDGTPFDAEAVKFNMDRFVDPKVKSQHSSELDNLAGVDVVDTYTVRYRLKAASAAFLPLVYDWNGFISSPTALKKWGDNDYGVHPVGAGPFKFVEHQDAVHTVIERNPDYWDKGKPYLDRIEFKPILNDSTREVEVRSGTSHIADQMPFQDVEKLKAMKEIVLVEVPGAKIYLPYWQVDQSPYGKSLEFRQALNWLIDREAIWSSVFFKTGAIGYDPFIPGTPFADPSYKPFTHNVDKAKALLDQAYKSGVPSSASFTMYTDEEPVSQKLCQIVQANYADVGIKVTLQNEAQAARTAREKKGDFVFSLNSLSWVGYRPDPAQYLARYWHSTTKYIPWPIKDAEIDRLIDTGAAETDLAKRKALYRQLADRINQLAPTIFLAYGSDIKALSPRVKNFAPHPDQVVRFTDMWLDQ
ncbi:MAG: ABC transporter substrate-binding protein [Chloroflexota bacterium]|nr:ABC transporter substrate-binding protein [Chloroflexota bacterium]MDE3193636.1 ABC transporter substrate-binding protein [Chloroflexota bacterium]